MAGVQFVPQHMPPQQQGYHQQSQQGYGMQMHPQNNHAPQMHMQQQIPHQQQYMQPNHNMGHPQQQMLDQQQYYHDHDRVDGKSAGGEQIIERKIQEIQALRYEVESLQKASDPNQSAAQMADRLAQQPDPFNEDSEWNMKQNSGGCCCIQ